MTKFFNVKINDREVVITSVTTALFGKFSKDVLTVLISSEFGLLAYKDLTYRDTKYKLSDIISVVLIFREKSRVSCMFDGIC